MNCGAMLNAYPDSMGGRLGDIARLLALPDFRGAFRSFYILPSVFHTDLDRGFSVISYDLDGQMAETEDIARLKALGLDLKLDFILNHLSVLSPQFQDMLEKGDASPYRDFFIDWNSFWQGRGDMTPEGYIRPGEAYLREMFFRKPGLPLLMVRFPDGSDRPYWNTFYQETRYDAPDAQDLMRALHLQYGRAAQLAQRIAAALEGGGRPADADFTGFENEKGAAVRLTEGRRKYLGQMDVDIRSGRVWRYYEEVLDKLAGYGASIVRLDAFGYASKIPGRRNFMNEPETWDILERIRGLAQARGLALLPEIHAAYSEGAHRALAEKGYIAYDFFLPGLVIDAIERGDGTYLARWANEQKEQNIRCVNMLGCHDGIPVLDLKGLVPDGHIRSLIDLIVARGGLIKNLHGKENLYYQVNATYFSALGANERKMLLARALQLFMPGKPQVWYLDLFAGENDTEAARRAGEAGHKEINRTNLTAQEVERRLRWPVVRRQLEMLALRNACPAFGFDARMQVSQRDVHSLRFVWSARGKRAVLEADLSSCAFRMEADTDRGRMELAQP